MARSVTLLPEPDSPTMQSTSPGLERKVDAIDRMHRAVAADEAHGQVLAT